MHGSNFCPRAPLSPPRPSDSGVHSSVALHIPTAKATQLHWELSADHAFGRHPVPEHNGECGFGHGGIGHRRAQCRPAPPSGSSQLLQSSPCPGMIFYMPSPSVLFHRNAITAWLHTHHPRICARVLWARPLTCTHRGRSASLIDIASAMAPATVRRFPEDSGGIAVPSARVCLEAGLETRRASHGRLRRAPATPPASYDGI